MLQSSQVDRQSKTKLVSMTLRKKQVNFDPDIKNKYIFGHPHENEANSDLDAEIRSSLISHAKINSILTAHTQPSEIRRPEKIKFISTKH